MQDIVGLARKAASSVVMVSFRACPWTGMVCFRSCDKSFQMTVIPSYHFGGVTVGKRSLVENLVAHSVPCREGAAVPTRSIKQWLSGHSRIVDGLNSLRDELTAGIEKWEESARSQARAVAGEKWKDDHPSDSFPPPSYLSMSENAAVASIPDKQEIIESFRIPVRYFQHPFVFMDGGLPGIVGDGELMEAAWWTVDELLASPHRIMSIAMEREVEEPERKCRLDKKLVRMLTASKRFLATELLGNDAAVAAASGIVALLDGEGACGIDWDKARALADEARTRASCFSSVAGITGVVP